ncbi:hypothetical protein AJ79_02935 [Helicocarpus griseus UAMH5409]|uniref:Uncharacterized protein n=1 Tax=Helicocarpus griseus UAMH5409 TaxID=1447875 RepID=A0A2B7XZZ6_9EURO|nr:hypothetical protein AJ79_02935 [Helicocarpus griseus UAMH5409]
MTSQGPGGSGNVADKMKDATQPEAMNGQAKFHYMTMQLSTFSSACINANAFARAGDSKTTTEKLSETVQQGMESAKKAGSGAMESAQDAAAKISESASGALGGELPLPINIGNKMRLACFV